MHIVDVKRIDSPQRLAEIRCALDEFAQTGQITEPVYFKGLVLLAWRYAQAGDLATAFAVASVPTMEYYRVTQVTQMEEDIHYQDAAVDLANRFVQAGMVSMEVDLPITQKLAQA